MPTPTPAQASSHYAQQAIITSAAVRAIWPLFPKNTPLPTIAELIAAYQRAAADAAALTVARWAGAEQLTNSDAYAGVSSLGFPVIEPVIATIDKIEPAPAEAVPAPWWSDATLFQHEVELLISSEVSDAARTATQAEMIGHGWTEYVRVLNPPSCPRCTILAGRVYRWSTGFQRHPGCDCQMVPTDDPRASDELLTDPRAAIEAGQVNGLSKSDAKAIAQGADPLRVVNATRGTSEPGITGATAHGVAHKVTLRGVGHGHGQSLTRSYKTTTEGVTKRAAWRRANPNKEYRLRPEGIYRWVEDQFSHLPEDKRIEIALQQLRNNGYM